MPTPPLTVWCLCAAWCRSCEAFQTEFEVAADSLTSVQCFWVDIEDHPELFDDDTELQSFPTLLIARANAQVVFFGPIRPHARTVADLVRACQDDAFVPQGNTSALAQRLAARWHEQDLFYSTHQGNP